MLRIDWVINLTFCNLFNLKTLILRFSHKWITWDPTWVNHKVVGYKAILSKWTTISKFKCNRPSYNEINQELFKRFYKPLYIPIVGLLTCFLILYPKNNVNFKKNRTIIFLVTFFILILSEGSLRYATSSYLSSILFMIIPWIIFISIYFLFYSRARNA